MRKKLVSNVVYHMDIALLAGDKFLGKANITFKMESTNDTQGLFLDFMGSKIHRLMINGKPSDPKLAFDGMRIKLDNTLLKAGQQNTVTLNFLNSYRSDGVGFHSFTDHTDNN
jgi:aminopeptidase N